MTFAPTIPLPPTLIERLALAVEQLGGTVPKAGRAPDAIGGFDFIRYDDALPVTRQVLSACGIVAVPSMSGHSMTQSGTTRAGNPVWKHTADFTFRLYNTADKTDFIDATWAGEGDDSGDKGLGKAATSAHKSWLLKLLQIAGGCEDNEAVDVRSLDRSTGEITLTPVRSTPKTNGHTPPTNGTNGNGNGHVRLAAVGDTSAYAERPASEKQVRAVFAKCSALGRPKPSEGELTAMSAAEISELLEQLAEEEAQRRADNFNEIPF